MLIKNLWNIFKFYENAFYIDNYMQLLIYCNCMRHNKRKDIKLTKLNEKNKKKDENVQGYNFSTKLKKWKIWLYEIWKIIIIINGQMLWSHTKFKNRKLKKSINLYN